MWYIENADAMNVKDFVKEFETEDEALDAAEDYEKAGIEIIIWSDEDFDYDDCDYEVGYDPYMGCFSDDC